MKSILLSHKIQIHRMRPLSYIAIGFIIILFSPSCTHKIFNALSYNFESKNIDGDFQDWKDTLCQEKNTNFYYSTQFDSSNFYFRLKTADDLIVAKILQKGFTFWIDTLNKKNRSFGINYPISLNEAKQKIEIGSIDKEDFNNKYSTGMELLEILDSEETAPSSMQYSKTTNDIEVAMKFDKLGFLTYELKIPFSKIYKSTSNINDKCFSILCETGYFEAPKSTEGEYDISSSNSQYQPSKGQITDPYVQQVDNRMETIDASQISPLYTPSSIYIKSVCIDLSSSLTHP